MTWNDIGFEDQKMREALNNERERKTLAELLAARGQDRAAALIASAEYRSDCVDNWDGGQYVVDISVPAALFDRVDEAIRVAIDDAARAVVGDAHYRGMSISVRRSEVTPGWDAELVAFLRSRFSDLPIRELPC